MVQQKEKNQKLLTWTEVIYILYSTWQPAGISKINIMISSEQKSSENYHIRLTGIWGQVKYTAGLTSAKDIL